MSTQSKKKTKSKNITWPDAIDVFITHLHAQRMSERTVKLYEADLKLLAGELAPQAPSEVQVDKLRTLQCALMSGTKSASRRPLAAASVARVTSAWRSFFRFLAEEDRIPSDPTARLESPHVPKRAPLDALSVKEVERLLDAPSPTTAKGLRSRAILELLYSTGLRNAETRALDLTDIDHQAREVIVRCGKGEKGRVVPLTPAAYARIRDYLDRARPALVAKHKQPTEALLVSYRGRVSTETLAYTVERAKVAAGIAKDVTPHTLRRTFASTLLKNGVNVRLIQELLGHAHLSTTAIYLRVDRSELRRELLMRHPRERMEG